MQGQMSWTCMRRYSYRCIWSGDSALRWGGSLRNVHQTTWSLDPTFSSQQQQRSSSVPCHLHRHHSTVVPSGAHYYCNYNYYSCKNYNEIWSNKYRVNQRRRIHTLPPQLLPQQRPFSTTNHHPKNDSTTTTLKVAIVGAGPSGCYTAKYLQKALPQLRLLRQHAQPPPSPLTKHPDDDNNADEATPFNYQIDVFEKLPTPYGLVRYGVAPDHPEVKHVQNDFDALFQNNNNNNIQYLGNVQVGVDVTLEELRQCYSMVVLCYGCGDADRPLHIPVHHHDPSTTTTTTTITGPSPPTLDHVPPGMMNAREFVAWYNGHPHYNHIGPQLENILQKASSTTTSTGINVVIVGHGNVALDCARILAKGGAKHVAVPPSITTEEEDDTTAATTISAGGGLYDTDITTRAWNLLQEYPVSHISVVGRRGHVQASFTIKEVRELFNLEKEGYDVSFIVRNDELDMCTSTAATQDELNGPNGRPKTRMDKLLREAASHATNSECQRTVQLRFLLNPVGLETNDADPTALLGVVCERNVLTGDAGRQRATGTGDFETIPACLVLVSIGYKGLPIPGIEEWFDVDTGTIRNDRGRVDDRTTQAGGLYTSGWIKRGPNGIIGTNIADAKETVATMIADLEKEPVTAIHGVKGIDGITDIHELLKRRGVQVVDWHGYRRIELKERAMRRSEHQPREKIVTLDEQLAVAFSD